MRLFVSVYNIIIKNKRFLLTIIIKDMLLSIYLFLFTII